MRARGGRGRRRRGGAAEGHGDDERWLLTYADMITLLMALFMVLFAISSVNTSKFETLQRVLQDAFSGKILPGGPAVQQSGSSEDTSQEPPPEAQIPPIAPILEPPEKPKRETEEGEDERRREDETFRRLKRQIDAYARRHGLARQLETAILQRGLVVRLLTDRVLFDSGRAVLKPRARPLLAHIARLLAIERSHPVAVEGHTDNVPIASARFPSNWELSGARASSVVRFLIERGVRARRLEASGFADLHPMASNRTDAGRHRNRRVEIVVLRKSHTRQGGPTP